MQDQILLDINHPILKNHRVYGQELLPGLAYIDIIYQLFRENGYDYNRFELRNLSIYKPLLVGQDYSVMLSVACTETKEGQWQVRIEGQEQHSGIAVQDKKLYVTAEMHKRNLVVFEEMLDIKSMKQLPKREADLNEAYEQCRQLDLVHSGFMKAKGKVYKDERETLIDISLGDNILSSAEDFMFHPVLIDGSAIGSGILCEAPNSDQEEPRLFLPLFYESFCASALLQKQCIIRIQASSIQRKKELVYVTMEFFNESGEKVGELKNFINKFVREVELIAPHQKRAMGPTKDSRLIQTGIVPSEFVQSGEAVREIQQELSNNVVIQSDSSLSKAAQRFLKEVIALQLKQSVDKIDSGVGYYEMGLESSMLLEVVKEIEKRLSIQLTPVLLFEYTTIGELADYLSSNYPDRFRETPIAEPVPPPPIVKKNPESQSVAPGIPHDATIPATEEDIAIIGMAGRYPGAENLHKLWINLQEGKDCISEIPKSRWDWQRLEGLKAPSGKNISRWGGFLDDPDCFDPQFFRISPREAEAMDPQERLFLETCWETIEDAGYTPKTLVSPRGLNKRRYVGVFAGVMHKDYTLIQAEAMSRGQVFPISLNYALIANRVSYFCNFHGPSMAVDTVCSSSLIAVHLAIESIRRGESEVALAGGVNLSLHPSKYLTYGMMDMHASDGYCHTFGKGGDGYVSAEGIGAVLLKPLSKAIQDRDRIYAVIKGSAINHGGTVSGVTVPSPVAQADIIGMCLEKTGISPRTISYIEAHGTGTSLGDPIEIQGLVKAFRYHTKDRQFCSIGSIKSNIGHAESAAGISGLHKTALQLYHKTLVPSLHSEEINPYIDFEQSPFYIQHQTEEWKQPVIMENGKRVSYPRRAGISSFGAYGSNAHLILEEYLPEETQQQVTISAPGKAAPAIIPLSAKNKERLQAYVKKMLEFLRELPTDKNHQQSKAEGKTKIQQFLADRICEILSGILHVGKEAVEIEQEWDDYGVEPVHIAQMMKKIREKLKIEIDAKEMMQRKSVADVAAYLLDYHQEAVEVCSVTSSDSAVTPPKGSFLHNREVNLANLAYTLQIGREAMEERVAFIVREVPELIQSLEAFLQNRNETGNCYQGRVSKNTDTTNPSMTEEDSRELICEWMNKGRFEKLAEAWVKGLDIEWNLLYGETKPDRIGLPTYPFARESYWVPGQNGASLLEISSPKALVPEEQEAFEMMTFKEDWQEQALPGTYSLGIKTLVCFVSNPENQHTITETLKALDPQTKVIFISQSTTYKKQSQHAYDIFRKDRNSYREAFKSIQEDYGEVDAMLYLWTLEDKSCIQDTSPIVYILQGIASTKLKARGVLLGCQFDNALDRCFLESWIGFERSLGLVLPNTRVAAIYQEASGKNRKTAMEDWVRKLWAELQAAKLQSALYQEGKRYVYRIKPTTMQAGSSLIRPGGTYLITGGCGGLGLLFAEHFAKTQSMNLILTGRSPLNQEKKCKIKALEDSGSKVMYVQADVCDVNLMREGVSRAKEQFGGIHGVIHAAGIEGIQSILEKEIADFEKVLAPKIKGTLVLDELLREEAIDFICYFSSSSAILGDFGSCDYSIGNRFQMAYANYRNQEQRQGKAVVINWPLWKEGGMGVGDEENTKMYLKSSGQRFLESEEGIAAFDGLLTQNGTQHLLLVGQRSRVQRFLGVDQNQSSRSVQTNSNALSRGRRAEMQGLSLKQCLEMDLKDHIGKLLKISQDRLDVDANLADFGFDSISLAELAALLTDYYGIEITPVLFFGYPTLEKLTQYFLQAHQEVIQEFYSEDVTEQMISPMGSAAAAAFKQQEPGRSGFAARSISQSILEPIAVIGMSGRFPNADTVEEFWNNLKEGKECITEVPANRWDWREYYGSSHDEAGKSKSKWGGFISDIDRFDPLFFEISPKEAELMDPRQRVFLEEAWHAVEDAGYMGERIRGTSCGVYVGVEEGEYGYLSGNKGQINSNQNATLSARIAYALDLKGPNLSLTAACSSGLVAIHQACQALRLGECEMALAGGVSLLMSPMPYIGLSEFDMLSPDGKSYVFDQRANGLVPSEAVAVVLLKPLSKAILDEDHIYGCIKASGVNYDGKTNGITAPNLLRQAQLIEDIYDKYDIDPDNIQYVMSHSVGSKLGDSIEVQALSNAFGKYTDKKQYCVLGSVKPSIGHTFAASGVVSLISILMAMKYETIPALCNYETNNEYINFAESPFTLYRENQIWEMKNQQPRLGTVSTTGISGTNAHAVVEEYIPETAMTGEQSPINKSNPILFVLSARSEEQLKNYSERMRNWITLQEDLNLADMAYTLQVGREAMNYRLAFLSDSRESLLRTLKEYSDNNSSAGLLTAQVKKSKDGVAVFERDEDAKTLLQAWISKGKLNKVAELWVKGLNIDWNQLYGSVKPRRISLPTYPFAGERYWIPKAGTTAATGIPSTTLLHPLLHQNISDIYGTKFSSIFTGEEFFLSNHIVKGERVLPGVAYLEMARAAVEKAIGHKEEGRILVRLKDIVWIRPIAVGDEPVQISTALYPEENGEIGYEIFSKTQEADTEPIVYSQGSAVLNPTMETPVLDIKALQAQCTQSSLSPIQCYEAFERMGLSYGPGHRGIEQVYIGVDQVLAKLSLPSSIAGIREEFVLHPSMMDSALQASLSLMVGIGDVDSISSLKTVLPFAMQKLEIFGRCVSSMWTLIRYSEGSKAGDKVRKLDVDLCDETGKICVRMKGFSTRVLEGKVGSVGSSGVSSMAIHGTYPVTAAGTGNLSGKVHETLTKTVSELLNVNPKYIDADAKLSDYGFDPVTLTEFINKINREYNLEMGQSLFPEYQTLNSLAQYIVEKYAGVLQRPLVIEESKAILAEEDLFREKAIHYFKKLLSATIKLPANQIEADEPMEKYGVDSVMVLQLTRQLEKNFGSLPKTLFFEYQNIKELTGYFLEFYRDRLTELLDIKERTVVAEALKDSGDGIEPVKSVLRSHGYLQSAYIRREDRKEARGPLDIAVIGVSGRYPKAGNIQEFWDNLREGRDCITEIPRERWDHSLYFDEDKSKPGKTYSKWGGFLDGVDQFDPLFFNISPYEAERMDPQERLFLECVFETLEDAGYTRDTLDAYKNFDLGGNVGVYVGVMNEEYQLYGAQETIQGRPTALWGNSASIANRVSHFCNFHGPSMAVNTMCSSSLTAIHLACQSLQRDECKVAIAGGVNISIHPNKYLFLAQDKFISSKGRCESFGQGGDGYVPGEGVGAVLLKPLSKAIADGDHIYGIIKGIAVNHGGKTNGYTVPNPHAQASAIGQAIKEAGVDPRMISYLEAHGTGTSLGDPIEIAGLTKTFRKYTKDEQYCAIGSAKSNIGHCESAAGIAGVTKVLLQMKYCQLVPSLHSKVLNPNIDFSHTPFVVQQELTEWKRPIAEMNGESREHPRVAGISSFGAGGSNAHIVISEYIPDRERPQVRSATQNTAIIVLSAKNEEQLQEQAQRLTAAIRKEQVSETDLADIAYTLQVGREAMEERLAVVVDSIKELKEKLSGFVEGQDDIEGIYRGQVKRNKDALAVFAADEELQEAIAKWVERRKYAKLADLWVKGLSFDWNRLYDDVKPRKISLPTYPFARERYWVPETKPTFTGSTAAPETVAFIHPLLHRNTSNFSEQRFSSAFTGREFFLTDHLIKGWKVLPGVAYLEMARAAVAQAAEGLEEGHTQIGLKNVVWTRPIAVGEQPVQVHIGLYPEDNGEIAYEIYSESEESGIGPIAHSQGKAVLSSIAEIPTVDLVALQAQCCENILSSTQCYQAFKAMGITYGPAQQGIERVYVGQGQVLAKLLLPSVTTGTQDRFALHPSLMDSALQASIGLIIGKDDMNNVNSLTPLLPFALQEVEIFGRCTSQMWAVIEYGNDGRTGDRVWKFNITLCDDQGTIRVRMKGVLLRMLEGEVGSLESSATRSTLMLHPCWKEQAVPQKVTEPDYAQHIVILCEPDGVTPKSIETQIDGVRCITMKSGQDSIVERFKAYAVHVFEEIQSIMKDKPKGKVLIQIVIPTQNEQQLFSGLSGMLKTAQLENPLFIGQLIEADPEEDTEGIIRKLQENRHYPFDNRIRYQQGKRLVSSWDEVVAPREEVVLPWRNQGVYLITGGAGKLGLIFAKEIAGKARDMTFILTGRSPLGKDALDQVKKIQELGAKIVYRQVDVTDRNEVVSLIQSICKDFGSLHGIIHSAGVIKDNFIIKKTKDEFLEVMAPKVNGLVNLDQASAGLPLDFFIFFSSVAGVIGNTGQADYSTANAFMDAYAKYRNVLVSLKQRQGQTLSVNWPLWKEGGMHVDEEVEKSMLQSTGMLAMRTSTGIQALYQGLASSKDQVVVMEGDLKRLHAIFLEHPSGKETLKNPPATEGNTAVAGIGQELLQEKTVDYLKKLLSSVIKLPVHRIRADAPMEQYGISSIMAMQMTDELEKTFGLLSKTLFFEYQNIQDLSKHFLESYRLKLMELFEIEKGAAVVEKSEGSAVATEPVKMGFSSRKRPRFAALPAESPEEKALEPLDIAIIGVSGQYPGARNIQEFWENLRDGKDCITEIPEDRWDYRLYFDEDRNKPGKTYSKWGGFLEGVDQFDPLFFAISPREAELMDPMDRLFLETVWNLLESTGYTRETLQRLYQGSVGVYVGAMYQQYRSFDSDIIKESVISLSSYSSIANRISHYFNFQGPSIAVDTMCSSAVIAIHMACESLLRGECQIAVAGGVNLSLHPKKYLGLSMSQMIGSHADSRSFSDGDGYIPAEGVGAVLLKPLSKAIGDGDSILAVIKSTATNHGGRSNGYTVPNPNIQAKLIEENFRKSGIDPRTVSYVEAAANGSKLGDAIEITALKKVFQKDIFDGRVCAIGSVKSNIGHAEAASGIAQLTKVILQLQHQQLVPSIKAEPLNPNIDFSETPFYLQKELQEWKRPMVRVNGEEREYPRRATVSSFGAGGSNAHLIIEEYTAPPKETNSLCTATSPHIMVFSARNQDRLRAVIQQMLAFIECRKDLSLPCLAYTLQVGREAMECRAAMVVNTREELVQGMKEFLKSVETGTGIEASIPIFTGELEEELPEMDILLSGKVQETVLQTLVVENNMERLAHLWAKGADIPWELLDRGGKVRKISLPTYPFSKERYWISVPGVEIHREAVVQSTEKEREFIANNNNAAQEDIQNYIVRFLSQELNVARDKIKLNKNIQDYGVDSIIMMKFMRDVEKYLQIKITRREMLEYRTVKSLSAYLAVKIENINNRKAAAQLETKGRKINDFMDGKVIEALEKLALGRLNIREVQEVIEGGEIV